MSSTSGHVTAVRSLDALRTALEKLRLGGRPIALVPTMGALHAGHLALVSRAIHAGERVVASIFVNPTQFAPHEDYGAYPRREEQDLRLLGEAGVELTWLPSVAEMYPPGFASRVVVGGPALPLEGISRPGHFEGVATVVSKLFLQVRPDTAYFGEKDYQQTLVIKRLARDLDLGVRIVTVPTVRESDGLALSSRNLYLDPAQRITAPTLYRLLCETALAAGDVRSTAALQALAADARGTLESAGFGPIDYFEFRDAETLDPVEALARPLRLLAAAKLGRTRLIDNVAVPSG